MKAGTLVWIVSKSRVQGPIQSLKLVDLNRVTDKSMKVSGRAVWTEPDLWFLQDTQRPMNVV